MKIRSSFTPIALATLFTLLILLSLRASTGQLHAQPSIGPFAPGTTPTGTIPSGTIVLTPIKDNTLYENEDKSNGVGDYLFVGTTAKGFIRRTLLAFDLSSIPTGTQILEVRLKLTLSKSVLSTPAPLTFYRLSEDWGEGASNAEGSEGAGISALPGDATWKHRFFDTQLWTKQGGSFVITESISVNIGGIGDHSLSSQGMVADVQGWYESSATNFGWIMLGDENASTTAQRYESRENPIEASRPQLMIIYGDPSTRWKVYLPNVQK